jgi:hypothetical protein
MNVLPPLAVQPVTADNWALAVQFLIEWVSDGEAEAREHLCGSGRSRKAFERPLRITVG